MIQTYRPSDAALLELARQGLRARIATQTGYSRHFKRAAEPQDQPAANIGPRPSAFVRPRYGTPAYALALKVGWITAEEEKGDRKAWHARQERSLRTASRYAVVDDRPHQKGQPTDTGAYVPQLSARIENDPNLTDGARRCARKIAELTYRQNREGRSLDVTVTYLMKALGRSRRTIQRYLRLLEREGYLYVKVIGSRFSRMCVGLEISLCSILFARHHLKGWPPKSARTRAKPGASQESHNQSKYFSLESYKDRSAMFSVHGWSLKCMNGVWRAFKKANPALFTEIT